MKFLVIALALAVGTSLYAAEEAKTPAAKVECKCGDKCKCDKADCKCADKAACEAKCKAKCEAKKAEAAKEGCCADKKACEAKKAEKKD